MKYLHGDVFNLNKIASELGVTEDSLVLAHCIAADFGMYGGIARQFVERYDMKNRLFEYAVSENLEVKWKPMSASLFKTGTTRESGMTKTYSSLVGKAVKIGNVYNLITKELTCTLPTLENLFDSLQNTREQMTANKEQYLVIPDMIGCGIDGLSRNDVISVIETVFQDTDITVVAVKL